MTTGQDDRAAAVARQGTRGVAVITIAKAYFQVTGFAQPLILTRVLGAEGYGLYGAVLNAVSILNNVVVAASIQAMSRAVTQSGGVALRRGLVLHGALGLVIAGLFAALADPIGVGLLGDPQLPRLLRVAALVTANYSVYAALVGALNGQQRFVAQAGLDMTFATLRTALVIALAIAAHVAGAVTGFAVASGLITALALALVWRSAGRAPPAVAEPAAAPPAASPADEAPADGAPFRAPPAAPAREAFGAFARRYVGFFAPVLLYQFALNLVLQGDLLLLKALLIRRAGATLGSVNAAVGVYKAVQNFAFLPYQLLLAVTFVVFPIVSRTTLEGDRETTRRFVRGTLRFSALAVGGMLVVLAGHPEAVLRLAYRPELAVGATALRVLAIGQGAFALAVIAATIVLAAGRTAATTGIMGLMLAVVFAGDWLGITLAPGGVAALGGVAAGTAAGCIAGLAAFGAYTRRLYGAFVPAATAARALVAGLVAGGGLAALPYAGKLATIALSAAGVAVYVGVLVATGEIGPAERAAIRGAVAKRLGRKRAA